MTQKQYHPTMERCVDLLRTKVRRSERHYFRLLTSYYFSKLASMMRTNIHTKDRGVICVNTYLLNMMPSGYGKGHSTNIFEENLIVGFRKKFLETVFPHKAELNLIQIASMRATRDNIEEEASLEKVQTEFENLGVLPFSFDTSTGPALKQLRQKLLMASAGSMNVEIDEIAQNLLGNAESLNVLFELYDKGLVKQKLIKNTKENVRSEEIEGYTPTNLMMFGTPLRLLDGGKLEEEFMMLLGSGYARRLLFGYSDKEFKHTELTASEIYDSLTDISISNEEGKLRTLFTNLATISNFGHQIEMHKDVSIKLIEYQLDCEKRASKFSKFDEMQKAEMTHRYFKAMKLSGAYAFVDGDKEISEANLNYAIQLVEDSGEHFKRIQDRDAPYVRLAKYLAYINKDVTNVDLIENLQFYPGSESARKNMMLLAIAYGYRNNIVIKRSSLDDIEFFSGESLEETNLDKIPVSYSPELASGYVNAEPKFSDLHKLTQLDQMNFTAHHLKNGKRDSTSIIQGCNLCVLDIDDGCQLHVATDLLSEYTFLAYTTKRHTGRKNRFRLLIPLSHQVKLSEDDFKRFMKNIYTWLPFNVDEAACDRPRKWASNNGTHQYNTGKLLDVTKFIPRTDKAIKQQSNIESMEGMNSIERWFAVRMEKGNRNNILLRFGLVLLDSGIAPNDIQTRLLSFNSKTANPMDEKRIFTTVMSTINNRAGQKSKE